MAVGGGGRLADVVDERGQTNDRARLGGVDRSHGVVPQVLAGDLVLGDAALGRELGRDRGEDARRLEQAEADRGPFGGQDLRQLQRDPLPGQVADPRSGGLDRGQGRGLDRPAERCREPDRADDPERVLREPSGGIADRPDQPGVDVGETAERVDQGGDGLAAGAGSRLAVDVIGPRLAAARDRLRAPRDRVHREVAPGEVGLDRRPELDAVRPPEIGVVVVAPERRDLVVDPASADRHGAEPVLVCRILEQARRPFRQGRGREVPVARRQPGEDVADGSAHDVRGVARSPQRREQVVHVARESGPDPVLVGHVHIVADRRRTGNQFRPRKRYVRQASLCASARYGVNIE